MPLSPRRVAPTDSACILLRSIAPGPGFLILFVGGGLRVWKRSPLPMKILLVIVGLALAAGAAYLGYRIRFAR